MTDVARFLHIGCRLLGSGAAPSFQSHSLDANNDGVGWTFRARDTNAITHIGFRYGARTGTPPTYRASLQATDSNGHPDGTVLGGGSPASVTFTPPADTTWDGLWQWVALTNSYTPTLGQKIFLAIEYSSGTVDASNFSSITSHVNNVNAGASFPKAWRLTAGSWGTGTGNFAVFGLRTASSRYGNVMQGFYTTRTAATVGHRAAMKFRVPSGPFASYGIGAVQITGSLSNASNKEPILGLWEGTTTLMATTLNTDDHNSVTSSTFVNEIEFDDAPSALTPGTDYRIGLEVGTAVNSGVIVQGIQLADAADRDAWEGSTNVCLSTFDGSSWTDDATVVPQVHATLYDITGNTASGGGSVTGGVFYPIGVH